MINVPNSVAEGVPLLITKVLGARPEDGLIIFEVTSGSVAITIAMTPEVARRGITLGERAFRGAIVEPMRVAAARLARVAGEDEAEI